MGSVAASLIAFPEPFLCPSLLDCAVAALGDAKARRFLVLLADGNVLSLSKRTPEKTLRALITASGGEEVALPGR